MRRQWIPWLIGALVFLSAVGAAACGEEDRGEVAAPAKPGLVLIPIPDAIPLVASFTQRLVGSKAANEVSIRCRSALAPVAAVRQTAWPRRYKETGLHDVEVHKIDNGVAIEIRIRIPIG